MKFPQGFGKQTFIFSSLPITVRFPVGMAYFLPLILHPEFILKMGQVGVAPLVQIYLQMGLPEDPAP